MPRTAQAENYSVLETRYSDVYYTDDTTLGDFFWRISGRRLDPGSGTALAELGVDRIADRVQYILDMYPRAFRVKIIIHSKYVSGEFASYSYETNTITIYADRITDGILAHEIAHAVICNYFDTPPPEKMQEVLTQYVDKHLWEDY